MHEDLVYFTHEDHAGVSAFAQEESDQEHRNASFAAVGVLVPRGDGRLGTGWAHAKALQDLARAQAKQPEDTRSLVAYWDKHGRSSGSDGTTSSCGGNASQASGYKRKRSLSGLSGGLASDSPMPARHPMLSIAALLSSFGPLLFPLYRAALLQKRILLLGRTPVHPSCLCG